MNHEIRDASVRVIGVGAGCVAALIVLSAVVSAFFFGTGTEDSDSRDVPRQTSFTNGPRAEPDVRGTWRRVTNAAESRMNRYAWIDRDAGVAQIPIERAMALVATGVKPAPPSKSEAPLPP